MPVLSTPVTKRPSAPRFRSSTARQQASSSNAKVGAARSSGSALSPIITFHGRGWFAEAGRAGSAQHPDLHATVTHMPLWRGIGILNHAVKHLGGYHDPSTTAILWPRTKYPTESDANPTCLPMSAAPPCIAAFSSLCAPRQRRIPHQEWWGGWCLATRGPARRPASSDMKHLASFGAARHRPSLIRGAHKGIDTRGEFRRNYRQLAGALCLCPVCAGA